LYRLVPTGTAWYRINFFLRAQNGAKNGLNNQGAKSQSKADDWVGTLVRYRLWRAADTLKRELQTVGGFTRHEKPNTRFYATRYAVLCGMKIAVEPRKAG
jgi:hypothetical protein